MALAAGFGNPIQSAANAGLNKALGPASTVLTVYSVALAALLCTLPVLALSDPSEPFIDRLSHVPWWAWVGGLFNVAFVLAGSLAAREIGSAVFTVTVASCAIALSVLLDHFGLLGLEQHTASPPRLIGATMAIRGIFLVSMF
ncbi:DMT family transporter [Gluconobacter japonicus]|uniref:DMT family transporter n=1 Tax=Gluconobacter japonicus TaxID=376620 RepID=UPI0021000965|nr:DMT family transporter [Gluconobacter japonicus]